MEAPKPAPVQLYDNAPKHSTVVQQHAEPIESNGFWTPASHVPHNIYAHEAFRSRLWRAYKGASTYEVAKVWAEEADIELIWNAPKSMALKQTISMRAPFTNVIEQLISQYDHAPFNLKGILSVNKEQKQPQLIVISQP